MSSSFGLTEHPHPTPKANILVSAKTLLQPPRTPALPHRSFSLLGFHRGIAGGSRPVASEKRGSGMAITSQTASKSTGEKEARRQLAKKVAQAERNERRSGGSSESLGVDYILCAGGGSYVVKLQRKRKETFHESQLRDLDPLVLAFCRQNPEYKLTSKKAVWWGLLDKHDGESTPDHEEYTVRWVKFDPNLGLEEEPIKGGFLGKESERSRPFSICLYSLGGLDKGFHVSKELRELFKTCTTHRSGEWVEVGPLGSRQATSTEQLAPYIIDQETDLPYRSTELSGCVQMAAANVLHLYDPEAANRLSQGDPKLANLAEFANYIKSEIRTWRAENPFKRLAKKSSRTYMGARDKLEWILGQETGIFLVVPVIKHGGNRHVVGVDCAKKVVCDPLEQKALRLCAEVMALCAGGKVDEWCGLEQARQLHCNPRSEGRKRRRKTKRRGRNALNPGEDMLSEYF